MKRIPIPTWEASQLDSLAGQNRLDQVQPDIIAVIDLAESHGQGGYVNSEGYGGWFGLSQQDIYSEGGNVPLTGTSQHDFDVQAETAAKIFANLLAQSNGNPELAEQKYQGGSHEGSSLMQEYGITGSGLGYVQGTGGGMPSPGHNSGTNHTSSANTNTPAEGGTMQADIFNSLQESRPGYVSDLGIINPLNWVTTAADWTIAQIIPLLLAAVFVLIALILIWHLVAKEIGGVPGPLQAAKDAGRTAAMGMFA